MFKAGDLIKINNNNIVYYNTGMSGTYMLPKNSLFMFLEHIGNKKDIFEIKILLENQVYFAYYCSEYKQCFEKLI